MRVSVLVNTSDPAFGAEIKRRLRHSAIRACTCQPGRSFMEAAVRERPAVAVLDGVDARVTATDMEIELLKGLRPDVRIIVLSRQPSAQDAWIVERGVFFYMPNPAMPELVRVIEAAARPPSASPVNDGWSDGPDAGR